MDEDDLVERARAGEPAAFEALLARHQESALRVGYAIVPTDAEDVVQEAFVKAYTVLPRSERTLPSDRGYFGSWPTRPATIGANTGARPSSHSARALDDERRR